MTGKIFRAIFFIATVVLFISFLVVTDVVYKHFTVTKEKELLAQLHMAAAGVERYGTDYLKALPDTAYRFTWIENSGRVLYDTSADETAMENHAAREEIQEALLEGEGTSRRLSETRTEQTQYVAIRLKSGDVLRIAAKEESFWGVLKDILPLIGFAYVLAVLLSLLLANIMSKEIVEPINNVDLDHPLKNESYAELSPLLLRLDRQQKQIRKQMQELVAKTREFEQISHAMREGLVLLDARGEILSINKAAREIFDWQTGAEGVSYKALCLEGFFREGCRKALGGENIELSMAKNEKDYQIRMTAIIEDGAVAGVVLLAFDNTAAIRAQKVRREFSANVSHELKTPLQSIIGSAELLENGLVKKEDVPRFVGHIRKEAGRLVDLIGDIMHLSRLEEEQGIVKEPIPVATVAEEVYEALSDAAKDKSIALILHAEPVVFMGAKSHLYEMIYNLADNAIRYNRSNGTVTTNIYQDEQYTVIEVKDTGIGIAKEHQERIFERFYRVDKSRSKETGGTGLGLSIVKHAAMCYGGTILVDSIPLEGTTIKVLLPNI